MQIAVTGIGSQVNRQYWKSMGRKRFILFMKGYVPIVIIKKGKECVVDFVKEGEFAIISHCLYRQKGIEFYFKALNNSLLLVLSYDDFISLWKTQHEFTCLFYNVIEIYLAKVEMFHYHSRYCTAKERICHFLQEPVGYYLLLQIPRYYIASYLDISRETFSSILGQLSKGE